MSRSSQNGISKLKTDPQLSETITIDRNSKEHTQNKINQEKLPQSKKYFSFFIKIETKLNKKYLKTKKKKEWQGRSHLIYSQARTSSEFCIFILSVI